MLVATAAPPLSERIQRQIGDSLIAADAAYDREIASANPYLAEIIAHTQRFRGKRLRPMLLLLSADACGGIRDAHITLAAVVEMIHTATLVHDDVLDAADRRRHVATVHSRWNRHAALLFGDHLFTHAFHLAASVGAGACRRIGRATNAVCEGEMTQNLRAGDLTLTEPEYLRIAAGKTGALCAVACELGARYAGSRAAPALASFGRRLGVAFQIADDLLDLAGDEHVVGKSLSIDARQRKLTVPMIRLLQSVERPVSRRTRELLSDEWTTDSASELRQLAERTGILAGVARTAADWVRAASRRLRHIPPGESRSLLAACAEFAIERNQ